jgi:hypothetical protein
VRIRKDEVFYWSAEIWLFGSKELAIFIKCRNIFFSKVLQVSEFLFRDTKRVRLHNRELRKTDGNGPPGRTGGRLRGRPDLHSKANYRASLTAVAAPASSGGGARKSKVAGHEQRNPHPPLCAWRWLRWSRAGLARRPVVAEERRWMER